MTPSTPSYQTFQNVSGELADQAVNTIRFLSADGVQQANSGHPGLPMGMADVSFVLWTQFLKHNPANPTWLNRDRFVLSGGHGSMLLYSLLYLTGYDLPMEELQQFRQWGSKTAGHPEYGEVPGVEMTTGPLGQGAATSVGMALAEAMLAARYNRPDFPLIDHYTYALVTDGDLMEGIASEAASLAGHLGLGKLIWLYDDNHISIDGSTSISFTEDRAARFRAYGWDTLEVDGHDRVAVAAAILAAQKRTDRPTIILCRTTIGFGAPNKQGTSGVHGSPLGEEELRLAKENMGWPADEKFYVPDDILVYFRSAIKTGKRAQLEWQDLLNDYKRDYPAEAETLQRILASDLPAVLDETLPVYGADVVRATRACSGDVLAALSDLLPELVGGSADLTPSNNTRIADSEDVTTGEFAGRYIRFGVREHAMAALMNGLALHGGFIPYGGTFFVFSDYMRPSIRLAAMMGLQVVYVFTHDSIGLGEDGPTHQPIEHIPAVRAMPNLVVLRPADGNETAQAWKLALERRSGPTALLLTRQGIPTVTTPEEAAGVQNGAYILSEAGGEVQVVLASSGSEIEIALAAQELLAKAGVNARVVSFPSWELFESQPRSYRDSIFPVGVPVVAIEAASSFGWERYADAFVGIDHFGASAPYKTLYQEFGFTAEALAAKAQSVLMG